jgi:hypothetical protein
MGACCPSLPFFETPPVKTLLSAALLLALAVPGAHAQDTQRNNCDACNSILIGMAQSPASSAFVAPDTQTVGVCFYPSIPDSLSGNTDCGGSPFAEIFDGGTHVQFAHPDAHNVHPTTQPTLDFSEERRWVHVSGVALADGQPVPGAKVNVIAALDGGFNNYQLAVTDARGVYNAWFKAPAAIRTVTVDVPSLCSTGNDLDCSDSYSWLGSEGAVITAPRGMTLTAQTPNSWLGAEGAVITGTDSF